MLEPPVSFTESDIICPHDGMSILTEDKQRRMVPIAEPWHSRVPTHGFIHDFVLATTAKSTPAKFTTWAALWLISSVLKREAWYDWDPGYLFANLWVIIVAPAGNFGKSTVLDSYCDDILNTFDSYIEDPLLRAKKRPRIFHGSTTIESLVKALSEEIEVEVPSLEKKLRFKYSHGSLLLSEFGTFLGKSKYKEDIVQRLNDLYSCKQKDDAYTISRGKEELQDVYITMLAATTPGAILNALPQTAQADGFMSRIIIAKQATFSKVGVVSPFSVVADTIASLSYRLAWIATNAQGAYRFDAEATEMHRLNYWKFRERAEEDPSSDKSAAESRLDSLFRKIALIVRASRYTPGRLITAEDYIDAERLVLATYKDTATTLNLVGASKEEVNYTRVRGYIEKLGVVTRLKLQRRYSAKNGVEGIRAPELAAIIGQLSVEGEIRITLEGHALDRPSNQGKEVYTWSSRRKE